MKLPDLLDLDAAGVIEFHGAADSVAHAARDAHLAYLPVDLAHADSKAALLATLAKALKLPEHFGNNWDALADCLEDDDFVHKPGAVIRVAHAGPFKRGHAADWDTLADILAEAAEYWKERHIALWIVVA